jgi:ABC-2 type transport system ATP-binding protein
VEHKGTFGLNGKYELVSQQLKGDEHYESVIKMSEVNTNQLLRDLVSVTEVHGFFEKVPTMSEIFISLVKGNTHE